MNSNERADVLVAAMARELQDHSVVATGVASPLAILAIAVAKATHAPGLHYLSCVGSLNPSLPILYASSEDLRYLQGRSAEVSIPELFDHARRGRIDTVFFGAAEIDRSGQTNMSAAGSLSQPSSKFPGVAGAATLRRWVKNPVLLLPKQSRRSLVEQVQVASTRDPERPVRLMTDLGVFLLCPQGASLLSIHPGVELAEINHRIGFSFLAPTPVPLTPVPDAATQRAISRIDRDNLRYQLVG
jgi:glutaconate CoA-transferase, subunit B